MALLVGNNTNETNNRGPTNGVARLYMNTFAAVATGTATSAFVKVVDWADEITSRGKVIVWNAAGTQIAISDEITIPPTTPAFASAAFSTPFAITNGVGYYLGLIVNSGTVDWYHDALTFQCIDAGGTYTYASPAGATVTGSTANAGKPAIYLDGTLGGGSSGVSWMPSYQQSGRPKIVLIESGMKPSGA